MFWVELQPIVKMSNCKDVEVWGYEVLYRSGVPNSVLFSVANPEFEIHVFRKELEMLKDFDKPLTFNLSPETLVHYKDEVVKVLKKRENVFIELTEAPHGREIGVLRDIRERILLDDFLKRGSGAERFFGLKPFGVKVEKEYLEILNAEKIKEMGSLVIVEKVETKEEAEKLKDFHLQGFLFKEHFIEIKD